LPYEPAKGHETMVIIAAFFFGLITFGFTLLTLMPLFLVWLMVGVYLEPEARPVSVEGSVPVPATSASVAREEALTPVEHLVGAAR
jgi:hypothetical protein